MKTAILTMIIMWAGSLHVFGQNEVSVEAVRAELANARPYTLAFFVKGPQAQQGSETQAQQTQMLHLQYLFTLKEQNHLLIFGPLTDESAIRGIMIFNSTDVDEVKKLLDNDPHVKAGQLGYEIHPWFGIPGQALK